MARPHFDPGRVKTPTQLLAAVIILLAVAVPALVTGAATVTSPSWAPGTLVIGAVAVAPIAVVLVFRLLTRYPASLAPYEIQHAMSQADQAAQELSGPLDRAGVDTNSLIKGETHADPEVRAMLSKLLTITSSLEESGVATSALPSGALLNGARALMTERRWAEAAHYLDQYVKKVDGDWQVQFTRGVAHANTRGGMSTNVSALRAYNEAIALAPADLEPNLRARLFTYRGAMAKRLDRLDEAEHDLLIARREANNKAEITDVTYNLACVYAMSGRKLETLQEVRKLRNLGRIDWVRAHLDDYFRGFRDDPDFKRATNSNGVV